MAINTEATRQNEPYAGRVSVYPGNCGFPCSIQAEKNGRRSAAVQLHSKCAQITRLGAMLAEISLQELFLPLTKNPIFQKAEAAGCHPSCPIPVAIIKTVEVTMGMAVAQDAFIKFYNPKAGVKSHEKP